MGKNKLQEDYCNNFGAILDFLITSKQTNISARRKIWISGKRIIYTQMYKAPFQKEIYSPKLVIVDLLTSEDVSDKSRPNFKDFEVFTVVDYEWQPNLEDILANDWKVV